MFDYKKFENDIVVVMENVLRKWEREYDDIYIFSLDCSRDMRHISIVANTEEYLSEQSEDEPEDYWYYKYCEAEWTLYDNSENDGMTTEDISSYMCKYIEDNEDQFTDSETYEYLEAFDEHCDKMIETCKNALKRFRKSIDKDFPDLLLAFNIGEYLDNEERVEIFELVNSEEAIKEYAEHIEDFN